MAGRIIIIPEDDEQRQNEGRILIRTVAKPILEDAIMNAGIGVAEANALRYPKSPDLVLPAEIKKDLPLFGAKGVSQLGTPIYSNLEIQGFSYAKDGIVYKFKTIVLNTVIMTVNQSKNIITTAIQGRNGTVKEYISDGDYQIAIKGLITGPNGVYPLGEVEELKKALNAPTSLAVNAWFLQLCGVSNIVITDYLIPQEMGRQSTQAFEIMAISDTPIDILINQ